MLANLLQSVTDVYDSVGDVIGFPEIDDRLLVESIGFVDGVSDSFSKVICFETRDDLFFDRLDQGSRVRRKVHDFHR